jgi:type IX secretion system PorP/SprF family membrane protein
MKKRLLSIFFIFLFLQTMQSQGNGGASFDMPYRNSLRFNKYIMNPTFSYVREDESFVTMYNKRQWIQFDDAPQTYFLNYSGRFRENNGIGVGLFQQNYGVFSSFGIVGNFAHNIILSRESEFTFGVNLGFLNSGLSTSRLVTSESNDNSLKNYQSNSSITINPGLNYGIGDFDFGLSANHLVLYNITNSALVSDDPSKSIQAHVMYTRYVERNNSFLEDSKITSLLRVEKFKDKTAIAAGGLIHIPRGLWAQVGYNTIFGISGGLGFTVAKRFSLGYNIEKGLGNLSNFGTSHEITLAYKIEGYGDYDDKKVIVKTKPKVTPKITKKTPAQLEKERQMELAIQAKTDSIENVRSQEEAAQRIKLAAQKEEENKLNEIKIAEQREKEQAIKAEEERKRRATMKIQLELDSINRIKLAQSDKINQAKEAAAAKARAIAEAKEKAEADKRRLAEEAKAKADADRLRKEKEAAEAKALRDRQEAERLRLEEESRNKSEAEKQRLAAEAKAKADALKAQQDAENIRKAKEAAEAKAKADAEKQRLTEEAKAKADALKAQQDAENIRKAKEAAEAKAKADAEKQRLAEEAKAKADALKAQQDAENIRKAKEAAEAKAKADAEKQRLAEEAKAKADALKAQQDAENIRKAKEAAEAKAKAEAEKLRLAAEAKAKADALKAQQDSESIRKAKEAAEAKAKAEAERIRLEEEAKAKANALNQQAEAERLRKEKEAADAKAKADADAALKAAAEANKTVEDKQIDYISQVIEDSKKNQDESLARLEAARLAKEKELKALRDENDASEKGIASSGTNVFQSSIAANRALEALKLEINENAKTQSDLLDQFQKLYNDRLKKVPNKNDLVNQNYLRTIEKLKLDKLNSDKLNASLIAQLEQIKIETDIEKKRRIKRATFDNSSDKFAKDRATLKRIKETTPKSTVPLTADDFDFGDTSQSSMQIVKNIDNVDKGYYAVLAVHSDEAKRDAFLAKAFAAGETNIDFFYDVNQSKYFIYYKKFTELQDATKEVETKGSKPYNGKTFVIRVE